MSFQWTLLRNAQLASIEIFFLLNQEAYTDTSNSALTPQASLTRTLPCLCLVSPTVRTQVPRVSVCFLLCSVLKYTATFPALQIWNLLYNIFFAVFAVVLSCFQSISHQGNIISELYSECTNSTFIIDQFFCMYVINTIVFCIPLFLFMLVLLLLHPFLFMFKYRNYLHSSTVKIHGQGSLTLNSSPSIQFSSPLCNHFLQYLVPFCISFFIKEL